MMREQVRVMLVDIRMEDLLPWTISYLASEVKLTLLNEATAGFHHTNNFSLRLFYRYFCNAHKNVFKLNWLPVTLS
jgi:hypothetical protein